MQLQLQLQLQELLTCIYISCYKIANRPVHVSLIQVYIVEQKSNYFLTEQASHVGAAIHLQVPESFVFWVTWD